MILLPPLPERRVWQQPLPPHSPPAGDEPPAPPAVALYLISSSFFPSSPCHPPSRACVRAAHPAAVTAACAPPMGRLDGKPAAAPSARGRRWQRLRPPGRPRWRRQQRQPPPPLQQPPLCLPSRRLSRHQKLQLQQKLRPRNVNGRLVAGLRAPHNTTQFLMCDEYKRERLRANCIDAPSARDVGDLDGYARAMERARGGAWGLVVPCCVAASGAGCAADVPSLAEADYEPTDEDWARSEEFMERDFAAVFRDMGSV